MILDISTTFKLLDKNNDLTATINIATSIVCDDKSINTKDIYNSLKNLSLKTIPPGYSIEDLSKDEYEKYQKKQ